MVVVVGGSWCVWVCGYVVVVGGWGRRWECGGWCGRPAYVLKHILSNRCEFFFEL